MIFKLLNDVVELPSQLTEVRLITSSGHSLLVLFNKPNDVDQNKIMTRLIGNITLFCLISSLKLGTHYSCL